MIRPFLTESRHRRQASAKDQRMQENPYSAEANCTQQLRPRNQARSIRSPHLANFGILEHKISPANEQRMAGSSTSSSFSQPATGGLHMESSPAQYFHSRSAHPLHHPNFDELKGSNVGLRQDLELDLSLDQGLIDGSGHNSLPTGEDVLTPQELSWRHSHLLFGHQLSTSDDTAYGSYGLGPTANDHAWPSDFIQDPVFGSAYRQTYDGGNSLDHPDAIKIKGSSGHYKPHLASSFPPSADCYPDYMPATQNPRTHRAITSASQPTSLSSSSPHNPSRKNSYKPTSARGSGSGTLSIIREYGHPQHGSPSLSRNGSAKGKRKGPLPTATALAAAQKRKDGSVCIRCRTMKMTVGRRGRALRELADHVVVQRGPSLRGLSSDYEVQIVGPVLHPCEFHRYGQRGHMQRSL